MIEILAPAKINLYLHINAKRSDGYHDIDSLVTFANIGDRITIEENQDFYFHCTGPYANSFNAQDQDNSLHSSNLVVQAAQRFAHFCKKDPKIRITLEKNIPLSSGLGGGSSDAAATLWALHKFWDIPVVPSNLQDLMLGLGSDVPVCFFAQTAHIQQKGDQITPIDIAEDIPALLVNPHKHCSTRDIFLEYTGNYRSPINLPSLYETSKDLSAYLVTQTDNDLTKTAQIKVPEIATILEQLQKQSSLRLARMSGSGASCFGLFDTWDQAQDAAEILTQENPDWWIRAVSLGSLERY